MKISNEQKVTIIGLMIAVSIGSIVYFYNHFLCPEKPSEILDDPKETVAVKKSGGLIVHVCGAVKREGVYELSAGDRVIDAVRAAGGAMPEAELSKLNLAEEAKDGQKILVPEKVKPVVEAERKSGTPKEKKSGEGVVNINTASEKELDDLPGIGPATAKKIIAFRPYSKIEDLSKIDRFGKNKIEKLRTRVSI
ncbi:MAG: ComEA family DNA-binding protein [Candidatus Margulisiibacteriota bacterium]